MSMLRPPVYASWEVQLHENGEISIVEAHRPPCFGFTAENVGEEIGQLVKLAEQNRCGHAGEDGECAPLVEPDDAEIIAEVTGLLSRAETS